MRTIRQEMKDERTQRMEAEVRMIRSLEETVQLSAQRLLSLKTNDTNSVMNVLYDIKYHWKISILFVTAILRGSKSTDLQFNLSTVD